MYTLDQTGEGRGEGAGSAAGTDSGYSSEDTPSEGSQGDFLRITMHRRKDDPAEMTSVIALPLLGIDGNPSYGRCDGPW